MTTYSTRGFQLAIQAESALGTATGSAYELRTVERPEMKAEAYQMFPQPNKHLHYADIQDKPVLYEKDIDAALKFKYYNRCPLTATLGNDQSPIISLLESHGLTKTFLPASTTLATYVDTNSWTLTSGYGSDTQMLAHIVRLGGANTGMFWPSLAGTYVHSTTAVEASMGLPSAAAALNTVERMATFTPSPRQVPTTKTLSLTYRDRAIHTTAPDYGLILSGCAVTAIDDIVIEPGKPITFGLTLHAAKVVRDNLAMAAEVYADTTTLQIVNSATNEFGFATASEADPNTALANATAILQKMTIKLGTKVTPILGEGSITCVNGIQGYLMDYDPDACEIIIEGLFDKDRIDDAEGTNPHKYIHFVQGGSAITVPMFAFWAPKCQLKSIPEKVNEGEYYRMKMVYRPNCALYGSGRLNASAGMAPWALGLGMLHV
jgi:hypothetical protein